MRPGLLRAALLLSAFVVTCAPLGARAWTDARVRSVSSEIRLAPDGHADVFLVARVRVDRGWLQAFEMDGLDPNLVFTPDRPARFEEENGRLLSPRVEHSGEGRVVFEFGRRSAPRHGDYVVSLAYETELSANAELDDTGHIVVRWTLPSWRYGLDDVAITIDAPLGARAVLAESEDGMIEVAHTDSASGTRLTLHRAHLPRTREWPIAIAIPSERMDSALRVPPAPDARPALERASASGEDRNPWFLLAASLLTLLALTKTFALERAAARSRVSSRPLVPLSSRYRVALSLAAALGAFAYAHELEVASAFIIVIAVPALHLRTGMPRPPRLGSFRPARADELAEAQQAWRRERFGLGACLDATTFPGMLTLGACAVAPLVFWAHREPSLLLPTSFLVSALAAAILLSGTRHTRPMPPLVGLAHLLRLASSTRCELTSEQHWGFRPVLHTDVRGELQDARLRIALPLTPKGLLRLDVVIAASISRSRFTSEPQLLIVTREGSPADRSLEEHFPSACIARGPRRTARQFPLKRELSPALETILDLFAQCPAEPAPARDRDHEPPNSLAESA